LFFKGAAELPPDLETGARAGSAVILYSASHALTSASANVGALAMSMHCKALEELAKSGTVIDARRLVTVIRGDYRALDARLSQRLPRVA
jgi:HPt (histidine-containing phosphotransfer) domain-containing protein